MSQEDSDSDPEWFSDADEWFIHPQHCGHSVTRSTRLMSASTDEGSEAESDECNDNPVLSHNEKAVILEELKKMEAKEQLVDPDWTPQCRAKKRTAQPVVQELIPECAYFINVIPCSLRKRLLPAKRKAYSTGPVIANKSRRSQFRRRQQMEGQTLLTSYLSVSPSPNLSHSPSSSVPGTPHGTVLEITDESEDDEELLPPLVPVNQIPLLIPNHDHLSSENPAAPSLSLDKLLSRTRLQTVKMSMRTVADSDSNAPGFESETDEEVDELIRGDEAAPQETEGGKDWRILRDQIGALLDKQKRAVTMRLSEVIEKC